MRQSTGGIGVSLLLPSRYSTGGIGVSKRGRKYIFIVQVLKLVQELKPKRHCLALDFFSNFRSLVFTFTPPQLTIEVMKLLTKVIEEVLFKLSQADFISKFIFNFKFESYRETKINFNVYFEVEVEVDPQI